MPEVHFHLILTTFAECVHADNVAVDNTTLVLNRELIFKKNVRPDNEIGDNTGKTRDVNERVEESIQEVAQDNVIPDNESCGNAS